MGKLTDGFPTIIYDELKGSGYYSGFVTEIEVQAPEVNGGGPIDLTTMRNTAWRTQAPKQLKGADRFTVKVDYDRNAYNVIGPQISGAGPMGLWRITWQDGSYATFYGFQDSFTPDPLVEGERPTATWVIIIDPTIVPVFYPAP